MYPAAPLTLSHESEAESSVTDDILRLETALGFTVISNAVDHLDLHRVLPKNQMKSSCSKPRGKLALHEMGAASRCSIFFC